MRNNVVTVLLLFVALSLAFSAGSIWQKDRIMYANAQTTEYTRENILLWLEEDIYAHQYWIDNPAKPDEVKSMGDIEFHQRWVERYKAMKSFVIGAGN